MPNAMRVLLLLLLLFPLSSDAQEHHQERAIFTYNLVLNGVTSALGAVINKPPAENWKRAFVNGFWQGSIGGALIYTSKKTLYLINRNEDVGYALPANMLYAAGASITESAAAHEPFLQNWRFNYGPVRVDFTIHNRQRLKVRLLPERLYSVWVMSQLGKLDVRTSLLTGVCAFKSDEYFINLNGKNLLGYALGGSFAFVGNYANNKYETIAHEMVHIFQYQDFQKLNTWLNPLDIRLKADKLSYRSISKYCYLDFPYFYGIYQVEGHHEYPHYFRNFFEFEAERYSTNSYVPLD